MPLIIYLDETGDHTMEIVDQNFPIFGLVMVVCEVGSYVNSIVPAVYEMKMEFFGHEDVILHSYDIRKQKGHYRFLTDPRKKIAFYERINAVMGAHNYRLISAMIRKQKHRDLYGAAAINPYDLAMKLALERALPLLEEANQTEVHVLAESRGAKEDADLKVSFDEIASEGTDFIDAQRFRKINLILSFHSKRANLVGMQLADLAAYPIARHALEPAKSNLAYDVIKPNFYRGTGNIHGLKIFP